MCMYVYVYVLAGSGYVVYIGEMMSRTEQSRLGRWLLVFSGC